MEDVLKQAEKIAREWEASIPSEGLGIADTVKFLRRLGFPSVTQTILRQLEGRYGSSIFEPPERESSKYRVFTIKNLRRIRILLSLQMLGFTASQIKRMCELDDLIDKGEKGVDLKNKDALLKYQMQVEEHLEILRSGLSRCVGLTKIAFGFAGVLKQHIKSRDGLLESVREKTGL